VLPQLAPLAQEGAGDMRAISRRRIGAYRDHARRTLSHVNGSSSRFKRRACSRRSRLRITPRIPRVVASSHFAASPSVAHQRRQRVAAPSLHALSQFVTNLHATNLHAAFPFATYQQALIQAPTIFGRRSDFPAAAFAAAPLHWSIS